MRILYVLNSLGMGGAERQVLALAALIAARGHTVALLVLSPRLADEWPTNLKVIHCNLHKNPVSLFTNLMRAEHVLREFKPDIVHSHSFHANIFTRLLRLTTHSLTVISTIHNVYEGGKIRMLAYRLTDPLANCTTAVSTAAAEQFIRLKAIPRHKCIVITNGIDIDEFKPDTTRRDRMRKAQNLSDEFIWLAASRIAPAKDIPNLLRAFDQVSRAYPTAQLWIAGAINPKARNTGTGRIGAESPSNQVHWLGLRRDLPALFDAADAFVLSSAWEGMPLAIGEAMSMAKSVVATEVGGVRELLGNTGTIIPPHNSEALANAMLAIMQISSHDRRQQGRAARERISSNYSIVAKANEWEALYHDLYALVD